MTSNTRRILSTRHVLGPLVGVAGFAIAVAATSSASAQGDAPPAPAGSAAPTTESTAAPATTAAPAGSATTAEDPNKKKAAPAAPAETGAAPAGATAAPTTGTGTTVTFGASATGEKKDEPGNGATKTEGGEPPVRKFAGSIFLFDQSFTTNSLSKGSQLSYVPVYEWWLSPRVYYNINRQFKVSVRQDLFKEWTNSEETTYHQEWRYTDTWLTASYSDRLKFISDKLKGGVSITGRPGISKDSRGAGQYFSLGPGGSLTYAFDITGEKGKVFKGGTIGVSASYSHAFTRCNVACDSGFSQPRQNSQGQLVDSDLLRSGSLTGNTLLYALNAGLEITDGLAFDASMIWIDSWALPLSEAGLPPGGTGSASVQPGDLDTRFRQYSWFLVSLGYDITKEFNLSVGYYNLNTVLAPDSTYRNPLWSPDARVFVSATFNLDELYKRIAGEKEEEKPATARTGAFTF